MKIAIDISILKSGGGVANYIGQLLAGLSHSHRSEHYTLFFNSYPKSQPPVTSDSIFRVKSFGIPQRLMKYISINLRYPSIEHLIGPVDLFHSPAHSPVYAFCPPARKWIVTVHDLFTFKLNYKKETQDLERRVLKIMDQKVSKVIAVSHSTRNDLIEMVPGLSSRTVVIHEGVDPRFFQSEFTSPLQDKYGLKMPYILYVGAADPHKNLLRLVNVYHRLAPDFPHHLVFAGRITKHYQPVIDRVRELNLQHRVIFTDAVSENDLPGIYKGAELFILPSLYEGFGLVLLEAMACGTPVIASNISSMPEVVGNTGELFDPHNEDDMYDVCRRVLRNAEQLHQMRIMGIERARKFSWQTMADETLKIYEEIA